MPCDYAFPRSVSNSREGDDTGTIGQMEEAELDGSKQFISA
jgi:hypothetical protein